MRCLFKRHTRIKSRNLKVLIMKCGTVVDVRSFKVAVSPNVGEMYVVVKISFILSRSINGHSKD
jgi:hypothetical protein